MKRVTDLDKFALEEVWRPYQTYLGFDYNKGLTKSPFSLDDAARMLSADTEWSRRVLSRIRAIGFTFPAYVVHPLVDVIKRAMRRCEP